MPSDIKKKKNDSSATLQQSHPCRAGGGRAGQDTLMVPSLSYMAQVKNYYFSLKKSHLHLSFAGVEEAILMVRVVIVIKTIIAKQ